MLWKGIIKAHLCVGQFVITVAVGLGYLNRSWDDVLAHICLPTIPAKLSAQVSVVLHSSISREDARVWNYNGTDRNTEREVWPESGRGEGRKYGELQKQPDSMNNEKCKNIWQNVKKREIYQNSE